MPQTTEDGYLLQQANPDHIPLIIALILKTKSEMDHPDWFAVDEAYLQQTLYEKNAWIFEATDRLQEITAAVVALYPVPLTDHLGQDAGLPETEWDKVAYIDLAATRPEGRGHRLQFRLMRYAEQFLSKIGTAYLLCTVHPDNQPSRRSIEKAGFSCQTIVKKYGGLPRCIYMKKI